MRVVATVGARCLADEHDDGNNGYGVCWDDETSRPMALRMKGDDRTRRNAVRVGVRLRCRRKRAVRRIDGPDGAERTHA